MTKVLTWNVDGQTSGGVGVMEDIQSVIVDWDPEVACLQEFGPPPEEGHLRNQWEGGEIQLYEFSSDQLIQDYYLLYYHWDGTTNRVNPAILWQRDLTPNPENAVRYPDPNGVWWRNAIGFVPVGNDPAFFTVHAISGQTAAPDARPLLQQIDAHVNPLAWVAAGDFNTEPGALQDRLDRNGLPWTVRPPDDATRNSGRVIDYLVHTEANDQPGSVKKMPKARGKNVSDHYPVLFENV